MLCLCLSSQAEALQQRLCAMQSVKPILLFLKRNCPQHDFHNFCKKMLLHFSCNHGATGNKANKHQSLMDASQRGSHMTGA